MPTVTAATMQVYVRVLFTYYSQYDILTHTEAYHHEK